MSKVKFSTVVSNYIESQVKADTGSKQLFTRTLEELGSSKKWADIKSAIEEVEEYKKATSYYQRKAIKVAQLANRYLVIDSPLGTKLEWVFWYNLERVVNYLYAMHNSRKFTTDDFKKVYDKIKEVTAPNRKKYNEKLVDTLNKIKEEYRIKVDEDGTVTLQKVEETDSQLTLAPLHGQKPLSHQPPFLSQLQ